MVMQVPTQDSFQEPQRGNEKTNPHRISRVWMTFFNKVSAIITALNKIGTVSSADASDLATAITLVNELKAKVNALNSATADNN